MATLFAIAPDELRTPVCPFCALMQSVGLQFCYLEDHNGRPNSPVKPKLVPRHQPALTAPGFCEDAFGFPVPKDICGLCRRRPKDPRHLLTKCTDCSEEYDSCSQCHDSPVAVCRKCVKACVINDPCDFCEVRAPRKTIPCTGCINHGHPEPNFGLRISCKRCKKAGAKFFCGFFTCQPGPIHVKCDACNEVCRNGYIGSESTRYAYFVHQQCSVCEGWKAVKKCNSCAGPFFDDCSKETRFNAGRKDASRSAPCSCDYAKTSDNSWI
jgi:hypothetical protein